MAFGDDALGDTPLGAPPDPSADPVVNARPAALYFNARTRDFPLGDDGRHIATDLATAACQTALFHTQGSIKCSPKTGNTLDKADPYGPRALAEADNIVRDALDSTARRGWISDTQVRMQPVATGGLKAEVSVKNHLRGTRSDFGDEDT
jgi:hypothetical protein